MTKTILNKNRIFFTFKLNKNFKDLLFSCCILIIMLLIILNPSLFSNGTISGIKLFFFSVFPGLFPFMFLTKLLTEIGLIFILTKKLSPASKKLFGTSGVSLYAFFMSILSGYPIGAQIIGDLYSKNLITKSEANKMSIFCTTSGPIFVIGAVGVGMLKSFRLGVIIYISHILSSVILGITSKFFIKQTEPFIANNPTTTKPKENIFSKCLLETISSILLVGAYITIFYLLSELLTSLKVFDGLTKVLSPVLSRVGISQSQTKGILYGIIEITRGAKELSAFSSPTTIAIISGLISFSGISIIMQSMAFMKNAQIKTHNFIFGKVVHSCLSVLICELILIFNII